MRAAVLAAVLALLAPPPARAQDDAPIGAPPPGATAPSVDEDPQQFEARVHLDVGRRHADEGQCELAIPRFRRVLLLDPLSSIARFHLGACLHAVGRNAEAVPVLEAYFAVADPAIDPERAELAARLLERARGASAALLLVVEPASALVTVDGRPLLPPATGSGGERTMRIDPGRHVIRAELEGWSTEVAQIEVEAGQRAWHLAHLEPRRAFLEIDTDPAAARVSIDDRAVAAGEMIDVAPGWHRVAVVAPGHVRRERDVMLADGERLHLDVSLVREARQGDPVIEVLAPVLGVAGALVLGVAIGAGIALAQ